MLAVFNRMKEVCCGYDITSQVFSFQKAAKADVARRFDFLNLSDFFSLAW